MIREIGFCAVASCLFFGRLVAQQCADVLPRSGGRLDAGVTWAEVTNSSVIGLLNELFLARFDSVVRADSPLLVRQREELINRARRDSQFAIQSSRELAWVMMVSSRSLTPEHARLAATLFSQLHLPTAALAPVLLSRDLPVVVRYWAFSASLPLREEGWRAAIAVLCEINAKASAVRSIVENESGDTSLQRFVDHSESELVDLILGSSLTTEQRRILVRLFHRSSPVGTELARHGITN